MSNSFKKTPMVGMTTATSEKRFKSHAHRQERAAVRAAMARGDEPPSTKLFGDPWLGDKDGKQYVPGRPEWVRK